MATFQAQVDAWVLKSEKRMRAVVLESAKRTFQDAQKAGTSVARPSAVGTGRMPIDTGFLRASFRTSTEGMPSGPSNGADASYPDPPVTIPATFSIGGKIWGAWSAVYAQKMEERYAFMRGAAQKWQAIVRDVVAEAKRRFP